MNKATIAIIALSVAGTASGCASLLPSQTLTVTTQTPGAEVYLSLQGEKSKTLNISIIQIDRDSEIITQDYGLIGSTPLTYSISTEGFQTTSTYLESVGTSSKSFWHTGSLRIEHTNGVVEFREFNVAPGEVTFNFDDPETESQH